MKTADRSTCMFIHNDAKDALRIRIAARVVAARHYSFTLETSKPGYHWNLDENSKIAVAQADSLIKELEK